MEILKLSLQGGKLTSEWRSLQQMPLDIRDRAIPKWEAFVLKPLREADLDTQFLEHIEVSLITSFDNAKRDLPLFSAEEPVQSALEERIESGRVRMAKRKLVETFGEDILSILRFRLVLRQVREARSPSQIPPQQ